MGFIAMLKHSVKLVHASHAKYTYWLFTIINIALSVLPLALNLNIDTSGKKIDDNGEELPVDLNKFWWTVVWYVTVSIVKIPINFVFRRFVSKTNNEIKNTLMEQEHHKFGKLTFDCKTKMTCPKFRREFWDVQSGITSLLSSGIPTMIEIPINAGLVIWTFWVKGILGWLALLCLVALLFWYFVTKKIQAGIAKTEKDTRKKNRNLWNIIHNALPRFEAGEKTAKYISDLERERATVWNDLMLAWSSITMLTDLSSTSGLLILLVVSNLTPAYFLVVSQALTSFTSAVVRSMNFYTNISTNINGYDSYIKLWDGQDYVETVMDLPMPDVVEIVDINITRKKKKKLFVVTGDPFTVSKGKRILLNGLSGSGKTTLINGITALIIGITLRVGCLANYVHAIVVCPQTIKEKLMTGIITIRQLFDDEVDNSLIERCLKLACIYDWAMDLEDTPKPTTKDNSFSLIDWLKYIVLLGKYKKNDVELNDIVEPIVDEKHSFDILINDRCSGGEKARLALATKIYAVIKKDAKWFILDEPDQMSDPSVAYKFMNNILHEFPEMTIILITHLRELKDGFHWDKRINIDRGHVTVVDCDV